MDQARRARVPVVPVGEDAGAPGALGVLEAFVNTVDLADPESDELGGASRATGWLARYGLLLPGEAVGEADVARVRELREALRGLALANHDAGDDGEEAYAELEPVTARLPVTMRFRPGGATLEPVGEGVDAALAVLLTIVLGAMADGTWRRFKACRNSTCQWAFWDASRNRSGKWCDMAVCGNRTKVRNYRERHAGR